MTEPEVSYIGRKTAAEKYRRGERTLERDISQALKLRDEKFLTSLRLRTKDGQVLPGIEVTFEKIDELKNSGQVPTWEISETFLAEKYGLRGKDGRDDQPAAVHAEEGSPTRSESTRDESHHPTESAGTGSSQSFQQGGLPPLPRDAVEQAEILKALYQDLQRELQAERQRNDKIFSLIETIPKQQEQTNILLREFQMLLKSGNPVLALPPKVDAAERQNSQIVDAENVDAENKEPSKEVTDATSEQTKSPHRPEQPTQQKQSKAQRSKQPQKRKARAPSKRAKRSAKSSPKAKEAPAISKPSLTSRYLPTLSRFFSGKSS